MPELPEVEIISQALKSKITQQKVIHCKIIDPRLRYLIDPNLIQKIQNKIIIKVYRKAKFCVIEFKDGVLLTHFGMSGSYRFSKFKPDNKHDHFYLKFLDFYLIYNDIRKFGFILWCNHDEFKLKLNKLGVEPLKKGFNHEYFFHICTQSNCEIKPLLMNMKKIVGIGNIYANEALFLSNIHPCRKANSLNKTEQYILVKNIKKVLRAAIKKGGTTIKDFKTPHKQIGYFFQELFVYSKEGEPCKFCNTPIVRIVQKQRSSFYCRLCQK